MKTKDKKRFYDKVNKYGPKHPILKTRCHLWTAGCNRDSQFVYYRKIFSKKVSTKIWYGAVSDSIYRKQKGMEAYLIHSIGPGCDLIKRLQLANEYLGRVIT